MYSLGRRFTLLITSSNWRLHTSPANALLTWQAPRISNHPSPPVSAEWRVGLIVQGGMELSLSRYPPFVWTLWGRRCHRIVSVVFINFANYFQFCLLPHMAAFKGSNVIFPKGHWGRVVHCGDVDVKLCMRPSCSWEMSMIFWLLSPDFCCFTFEFQCSTPTNTNESFYIFYASHTPEVVFWNVNLATELHLGLFPWNLIFQGECETAKETMFQES